jgi:hypothetical protein
MFFISLVWLSKGSKSPVTSKAGAGFAVASIDSSMSASRPRMQYRQNGRENALNSCRDIGNYASPLRTLFAASATK